MRRDFEIEGPAIFADGVVCVVDSLDGVSEGRRLLGNVAGLCKNAIKLAWLKIEFGCAGYRLGMHARMV